MIEGTAIGNLTRSFWLLDYTPTQAPISMPLNTSSRLGLGLFGWEELNTGECLSWWNLEDEVEAIHANTTNSTTPTTAAAATNSSNNGATAANSNNDTNSNNNGTLDNNNDNDADDDDSYNNSGLNDTTMDNANSTIILFDVLYKSYFHETNWKTPRISAVVAVISSWLLFGWVVTLSCYSYNQMIRTIMGLLIILWLPMTKVSYWLVLTSNFCDRYNDCELGRTVRFNVISMALDTIAGILVIFTKDKIYTTREQRDRFDRPPECDTMDNIRTLAEEERCRDGFNNAREVPVDISLIDAALVDPAAAVTAATDIVNDHSND